MIVKGTDLMVFATIGSTLKSIAFATNHSLTIGSNSTEISTKDSGGGKWIETNVQKLNWSMTTENLFTFEGGGDGQSFDDLFQQMVKREPLKLVFALENSLTKPDVVPSGGWDPSTKPKYEGMAFITDLSVNAPDGDNASFTCTFTGTGALTYTAPS
jgi:predicted secreted protein